MNFIFCVFNVLQCMIKIAVFKATSLPQRDNCKTRKVVWLHS